MCVYIVNTLNDVSVTGRTLEKHVRNLKRLLYAASSCKKTWISPSLKIVCVRTTFWKFSMPRQLSKAKIWFFFLLKLNDLRKACFPALHEKLHVRKLGHMSCCWKERNFSIICKCFILFPFHSMPCTWFFHFTACHVLISHFTSLFHSMPCTSISQHGMARMESCGPAWNRGK